MTGDLPHVPLIGGPYDGRRVPDPDVAYHEDDVLDIDGSAYLIDIKGNGVHVKWGHERRYGKTWLLGKDALA